MRLPLARPGEWVPNAEDVGMNVRDNANTEVGVGASKMGGHWVKSSRTALWRDDWDKMV